MKSFYFVSLDGGYLEFAHVCSVTCNCVSDALRQLHDATNNYQQMWVNVTQDEYVNLRNAEGCED